MLLEAKNINFRYGKGSWVIKDFTMKLNSGEIVGLSGNSGCGKTTLARILAGYEKPDEGHVLLDGNPLSKNCFNPVQLVFQHPEKSVNPHWKMHKTLNEGWSPEDFLIHSLDIEKEWLQRWPNELSGGELQRFCVARALSPKTRFLIADEMTTMLDAITQAHIWNVVLDIVKKNNIGVLVISHERYLIDRICSKVIEIN
jgi:peptide/nickel transport system ATP-binding protein